MTLTAGVISQVSSAPHKVVLSATAATGGTGPYTQQWYRSTTTGFSPGGGNILSGQTALSLSDTTVVPGTLYYYKMVYTDTGNSNVTVTATQLAVTVPVPAQDPNQFDQSPILGMIDERFDFDTIPVQIDVSEAGTLVAGQAVKIVDNAGGVPKVAACAANSDDCFGFINYNIKNRSFVAGMAAEVSQSGNVMYLTATAAIGRGVRVQLNILTLGGVAPLGADGADIVGWAFDKASSPGDLIRVRLLNPSFTKSA